MYDHGRMKIFIVQIFYQGLLGSSVRYAGRDAFPFAL